MIELTYSLSPKHVRVIFKIGIHFNLYVMKLRIELIILSRLSFF